MKKLLSVALFFILIPTIQIPEIPEVDVEEITTQVENKSTITFSDEARNSRETNFNPGQIVYVKIQVNTNKSLSTKLILQDSEKNTVKELSVVRGTNEFLSEFNAPSESGIYYLHFSAEGDGVSIINEVSLNVSGNLQNNPESYVLAQQNEEMNDINDFHDPNSSSEKEMPKVRDNFSNLINWIKTLFTKLFSLFTNTP